MFYEFNTLVLPPFVLVTVELLLGTALILVGWRFWKGPTAADRIVATELLAALLMVLFMVQVLRSGFISFLDVAFAIAIISFLGTVAFARYLENKEVPE